MSEENRPAEAGAGQDAAQTAGQAEASPSGLRKPKPAHVLEQPPGEIGGPEGPEPTRYGDWSFKGIASDF